MDYLYSIRYRMRLMKAFRRAAVVLALLVGARFGAAAEERSLVVGGEIGWSQVAVRRNIADASGLSRTTALTLSSAQNGADGIDLDLRFDAPATAGFLDYAGHYLVDSAPSLSAVGPLRARKGAGAALFTDSGGLTVRAADNAAPFLSPGVKRGDFSIEFWLYPATMSNGEQLLSWSAIKRQSSGPNVSQGLRCQAVRNRLEWAFADFFMSGDGQRASNPVLKSRLLVPLTWSHHLVRFDSASGLLEYLVDGKIESVAYATSTGGDSGEVYLPSIGPGGTLSLGARYSGLLDDFRIWTDWLEEPVLYRYPPSGGRLETAMLDLSMTNSVVERLAVKSSASGNAAAVFFLRCSDQQYFKAGQEPEWRAIAPNQDLGDVFRGRWAQIAVEFYPDGSGENTPVLEELRLIYRPDEPPVASASLVVRPGDGKAELRWRPSPDADTAGYLVYFGERSGYYWGVSDLSGASPIDVGQNNAFVVDGLRNGVLYFFTVAAYDRADPPHLGAFAREVSARPARTTTP